ncbi:polyketide synthase, partial [Bacillus licheniformis]
AQRPGRRARLSGAGRPGRPARRDPGRRGGRDAGRGAVLRRAGRADARARPAQGRAADDPGADQLRGLRRAEPVRG